MARLTIAAIRDMLGIEFAQARAEIRAVAEGAEQRLQAEIGALRGEMNRRFDRVDDRFDEIRAEFNDRFAEMRKEFTELKSLIRGNVKRRKR